jgi:hypothetical protein
MNWKRILIRLVAVGLIALIAVAATERYVVRDFLAAFLMFGVLLGVLGLVVLLLYLVGEAVVRCGALLVTSAAFFRLRHPSSPVVVPFAHAIGKS